MPDNEPIDVTPVDDQANTTQSAADATASAGSQSADTSTAAADAAQQVPPAPQSTQQVPPAPQPQYAQNTPPTTAQQQQYAQQNTQPVPPVGNQQQQQQQQYAQQPWVPKYAPGEKNYLAAGLLAIFLGTLGIHKFYMGYTTEGVIMLLITIIGGLLTLGIACAVVAIIAFIEGIIYITKGQQAFDDTYILHKKGWF